MLSNHRQLQSSQTRIHQTAHILTVIKGLSSFIVYLSLLFIVSCNGAPSDTSSVQEKPKTTSNEKVESKLNKKRIVFFGNSLTAGYGLAESETFTAILQTMFDSLQLPYQAINAGLSGETTAGGDRRIDWVLKQQMDIFFLELGANDMLRGTDVKTTEQNLRSILMKVRNKHAGIPIILAGMIAPPNMGQEYADAFAHIYPTLEKEFDLTLIPFFLDGVAGIPHLNQSDGIHPTAQGQKILAKTVWEALYPLIDSKASN